MQIARQLEQTDMFQKLGELFDEDELEQMGERFASTRTAGTSRH